MTPRMLTRRISMVPPVHCTKFGLHGEPGAGVHGGVGSVGGNAGSTGAFVKIAGNRPGHTPPPQVALLPRKLGSTAGSANGAANGYMGLAALTLPPHAFEP